MSVIDRFGKPCGTRRVKDQDIPVILLNGLVFIVYVATMGMGPMGMPLISIEFISSWI